MTNGDYQALTSTTMGKRLEGYQSWILSAIAEIRAQFKAELTRVWRAERNAFPDVLVDPNADFESIKVTSVRAPPEARNLMRVRDIILMQEILSIPHDLCTLAKSYNKKDIL